MASSTRWTWVSVKLGSWWWTGRPGVLWFMGLQTIRHVGATELNELRQHIKKQRYFFADKGPSSQGYGFSSSHIRMWELDYKESWVPNNWCFWTVVLENFEQSNALLLGRKAMINLFSSITQLCLTICDPMNHSTPGLPVHHQLPEFTQTHVHRVSDAIQPSHPLLFPSHPAPNTSQHQSLFQWVNSSHTVAKVLEFQLQHQSFQWTPRTDLL